MKFNKEQTYTYQDILDAVEYGFKYAQESQHNGSVPEGNVQQHLLSSIKRTSEDWQFAYPNPVVLDPDGWDRKNYQFSWHEEKITFQEYEKRVFESTCLHVPDKYLKK